MNTFLHLKEPSKKTKTLVYLRITLNGITKKFSTRESIFPSNWNQSKQRAKPAMAQSTEFNLRLKNIISEVDNIYTKFHLDDNMTENEFFQDVKNYLDGKFKSTKKSEFLDALQEYIDLKKGILSQGTISSYIKTQNKFIEFAKSYGTITFDKIDNVFHDEFEKFLTETQKLKINSVSGHIKNLKAFMNYSLKAGLHKNEKFRDFKRKHEKGVFVYFSKEDFEKVRDVELQTPSNLDKTRRLFVISCMTSLRHSDVKNINFENIQGDFYNTGIIKKNHVTKVPISDAAKDYIKSYFDLYGMGGGFTNQVSNWHLTKILMKAEVNRMEQLVVSKYDRSFETVKKPMYDWITFHYGRRYFIIRCLESGMQPLQIMAITGHEDFSVFQDYVKFSDKGNIENLNSVWK